MAKLPNVQGPNMHEHDVDLSVLIERFEVHNRTEGKSPRTVDWYNQVLDSLVKTRFEEVSAI